jgi:hypothetical protein
MRLLRRPIILGILVTLFLTLTVLATTNKASSTAFWLLFPGIWAVGSVASLLAIEQSESGGLNLILAILGGAVINAGIYALLFVVVRKVSQRFTSRSVRKVMFD